MDAPFRIGLLGFGNVGQALARRLGEDAEAISGTAGRPITLECIGVARNQDRRAPAPVTSSEAVLARRDLDAIVELIGGLEPAHTYLHAALNSGRQVITANKQLISTQGPQLARHGPLRFEASVGSAIPIVELLAETLAADEIRSVIGILNGTTNSMLQRMGEGATYALALSEAQQRGMAEADPTADVDGHDPAAKLAILMMLAFRRRVEPSQIQRIGIRALNQRQLDEARRTRSAVKLVAAALDNGSTLKADVRPRLIPSENPLGRVDGAMNAVVLGARYFGSLMLTGPGAGPDAAASAVVADLIRAARDIPASAGTLLSKIATQPTASIEPLGVENPFPAVE